LIDDALQRCSGRADFALSALQAPRSTSRPGKRQAERFVERLRNRLAAEGAAALLQTSGTPAPLMTLDVAILARTNL